MHSLYKERDKKMNNNLQQKIEKLDNGGFIPTGLGFPTQLKIEDVRSLKYQYYGHKYTDSSESYENLILSIKLKHCRMENPFWITVFQGATNREENEKYIIATLDEVLDKEHDLTLSEDTIYKDDCITFDDENEIENIEIIKEVKLAFDCRIISGDDSGLYTDCEPITDSYSALSEIIDEIYDLSFIRINAKISRDKPCPLQIQEAHNKLLSASSSNLYTVTVVHDFKIQYIKQFLTKEDAEKLFIDKCLYYYNEDGLEAFALTKDKALKDFDAKDFEEYFQSEQWNDCCDIANVEINIM
ncbi:MAG: hypothetical protein RBS91_09095 [Sulfurimonadaceae bacterium]|nr:hypothetical protein [Sulfurimonadaceae bacterium]